MEKIEKVPFLFKGIIFGKQKWFTDEHSATVVLMAPWDCLTNTEFREIAKVSEDHGLLVAISAGVDCLMISFT